eukprot:scaffold9271_cov100-Skeletonema_marinoi.AAC.3
MHLLVLVAFLLERQKWYQVSDSDTAYTNLKLKADEGLEQLAFLLLSAEMSHLRCMRMPSVTFIRIAIMGGLTEIVATW